VVGSDWEPTAHAVFAAAAAIAASDGRPGPPVTVIAVIVHATPFQCATADRPAGSKPATQTSDDDRAATAVSEDIAGAGTVLHAPPFQCATYALPEADDVQPTAHASDADTAATP